MKKTALIILAMLVLLSFSATAFAETNAEYGKALKYYNSGKYSKAVKLLKEYVKKNPKPAAYYRMGYSLYELKNYNEAKEYFKEAYLIDPSYSFEKSRTPKKYPKVRKTAKPAEGKAPQN